jgi:hypothetical protein
LVDLVVLLNAMAFLSGFILRANMPVVIQPVTDLIPLR